MLALVAELPKDQAEFRAYRNRKLYRSLFRIMRVYNRHMADEIYKRGFHEFSPAYPQLLSNLDVEGTRIGVLAARAGVTRQAAGQLLVEIEKAGFATTKPDPDDGRATIAMFTPKGKKLLANIVEIVDAFESSLAEHIGTRDLEHLLALAATVANAIDPDGAFGAADRGPPARKRSR